MEVNIFFEGHSWKFNIPELFNIEDLYFIELQELLCGKVKAFTWCLIHMVWGFEELR